MLSTRNNMQASGSKTSLIQRHLGNHVLSPVSTQSRQKAIKPPSPSNLKTTGPFADRLEQVKKVQQASKI